MSNMKNKIQKGFAILLVLISVWVTTAYAQQSEPFNIATIVSVPHIMPGDRDIGLEFIIQNNDNISVNNMKIYLFLRKPFSASISPNNAIGELSYPGYLTSNEGSGDEYTEYFNLAAQSSHETNFKLDIDRNATYGSYDLPYKIIYENGKEYSGKITLSINGNTLVDIKNVQILNGSKVEPGDSFRINVTFENVGDNEIKWLKLGLTPNDKAIIPLSSTSERIFKNIPHSMETISEFDFSLEKDAAITNYPIDLTLNYMDERGVQYNETKLVGIEAVGRATLDIAKKTTDPARIAENDPFSITFKIENTGSGDAKGVTARFDSGIDGDTLAYLGEIKKDDYSNAIFTLNGAASGKKTGILNLIYEDDYGTHNVQKEIFLVVDSKGGVSYLPIVVALIAIVTIYLWKKKLIINKNKK